MITSDGRGAGLAVVEFGRNIRETLYGCTLRPDRSTCWLGVLREATQLAALAARVLKRERTSNIPVEPLTLVPVFDWRQLQRWAIDESTVPAGSDVRFRELTVWQRYRWLFISALVVMALQTATIVGLVVQRARRREMQRALHDSHERYALATSAGRVGVWDWDAETRTIYVAPGIRELLGYPRAAVSVIVDECTY